MTQDRTIRLREPLIVRGRSVQAWARSLRRALWLPVVATASLLCPQHSYAQPFTDLISEIQQVAISTHCWRWKAPLESDCTVGGGVGLELVYAFRPLYQGQDLGAELDIGLGYAQTNSFEQVADSIRLIGAAREQPALFICGAVGYRANAAVFVCGRTGLLTLHDTQAWDSTTVTASNSFAASGSIFQIGGSLGIAFGQEPLLFTAQISRMWRHFDAVTWKGEAQKTIPQNLPRSLDLSGWGLSVGVSFQVLNADDEEEEEGSTAAARSMVLRPPRVQ